LIAGKRKLPWVLTEKQCEHATKVGTYREEGAHARGAKDYMVGGHDSLEGNIQSAGAEYATCLWQKIPWDSAYEFGIIDAGNYEVKWTHYDSDRARLLVRKEHVRPDPKVRYMLVSGLMPHYTLRGYVEGADLDPWWNAFFDCYAVPQDVPVFRGVPVLDHEKADCPF
jgi:hypothetical protein